MSYSPEQIEACILAYRNGDLNYCRAGIIDLLTAYAATLRQAARVDEGMVDRMIAKYLEMEPFDAEMAGATVECKETRDFCRELLTAALAQPTPAGEVVGRVAKAIADAAGHGMREKCEHMAHAAIAAYQLATWGHSERARVPDGWALVPRNLTADMVLAASHAQVAPGASYTSCWRAMLAAAPSQPEDAGECPHEWYPDTDVEVDGWLRCRLCDVSRQFPKAATQPDDAE